MIKVWVYLRIFTIIVCLDRYIMIHVYIKFHKGFKLLFDSVSSDTRPSFESKLIIETNTSMNAYLNWVNYRVRACMLHVRQCCNRMIFIVYVHACCMCGNTVILWSFKNTPIEIWVTGKKTLAHTRLSLTLGFFQCKEVKTENNICNLHPSSL